MGKTLHGKYPDYFGNIGVNLPLCVLHEIWVSMQLSFSIYPFHHLPRGGEGKSKYN